MLWDFRYAVRLLRRSPVFTATAFLSIALGAGATTAFFQLVEAISLRLLPVARPGELVEIRLPDMTHARGTWLRQPSLTNGLFEEIRRQSLPFASVFGWADEELDIEVNGVVRPVRALWVSGNYFEALGVKPAAGRLLRARDDYRGCGSAAGVVVSHGFWQREFGDQAAPAGRFISLGGQRREILGVSEAGFFGAEMGRTFDVALPLCSVAAWNGSDARLTSGNLWWLTVMARLEPDSSLTEASTALSAASPAIFTETLPRGYPAASVEPYLRMELAVHGAERGISQLRDEYRGPLILLFGIASLLLLVACVNVAHLGLTRAATRHHEIAMRAALGASRRRIVRQAAFEGFIVTIPAAAAGLVISRALCEFVVRFLSTGSNAFWIDFALTPRVAWFTVGLALAIGMTMSCLPAMRLLGAHAHPSLEPGSRVVGSSRVLGRTLMVAQLAIAFVLVASTFLLTRSLNKLTGQDAGFNPNGLVIADVSFAQAGVSADAVPQFRRELLERFAAAPGVAAVAEVLIPPLTDGNWTCRAWIGGAATDAARSMYRNMVSTGYFQTLGAKLIAGRDFVEADMSPSAPKVAIVTARFAARNGGRAVLGQLLWIEQTAFEPRTAYEIVGVAPDMQYRDLRDRNHDIVFMPLSTAAARRTSGRFLFRTAAGGGTATSVRATLAAWRPSVRVSFSDLPAASRQTMLREHLLALVSAPFGTLGLMIAALGIAGVTTAGVLKRKREFGVRLAVGATGRDILRMVLTEIVIVTGAGLLIGLAATWLLGGLARSVLFEIAPSDPVALGIAATALASVAVGAAYVPARRAATLDPVRVLKQE